MASHEIAQHRGRSHPPSLLRLAERLLRDERLIERGDVVLCACSGGPDSTALLHVLGRLRERFGFTLVGHGVDHGLRAEAAAELEHAERVAAAANVPFAVTRVAVAAGGNLQARAREARREALRAAANAARARLIATGHTADDRAETFLLRLLRGAGPRGLAVLPPSAALDAQNDDDDIDAHVSALPPSAALDAQDDASADVQLPAPPRSAALDAQGGGDADVRDLSSQAKLPHTRDRRKHAGAAARAGRSDPPPKKQKTAGIRLIRPLLLARRVDVEAHLRRHELTFARDPSNQDARFLRVRVRSELLPLLESMAPGIAEHLCALADMLATDLRAESALRGLGRAQQLAVARAKKCERAVNLRLSGGREVTVGFSEGAPVLMGKPDRRGP